MRNKTVVQHLGANWMWYAGAYAVVLLSLLLRVFQLDQVAVRHDEAKTIQQYIRPGLETLLTQNSDFNNHPLVSLAAYVFSIGHESLYALRWPVVLLGILTVACVIRLGRDLYGRREGLLAGFLIAIAAYHVFISQNLRGYAGLIGLTALSFFFAYRALKTGRQRYWAGFVISATLDCYAHLYGAVATGVIGLVALGLCIERQSVLSAPIRRRLRSLLFPVLSLAVAYGLALAMYAPMVPNLYPMLVNGNRFSADASNDSGEEVIMPGIAAAKSLRVFSLAKDSERMRLEIPPYHYGPVDDIARHAQGDVAWYLVLVSVGMGLALSWRRYGRATVICGLWLAIPFVFQAIVSQVRPGSDFRDRFLAFVYVPYLLLMVRGWSGWFGIGSHVSGPQRLRARLGLAAGLLGLGALTVLNSGWLTTYYLATMSGNGAGVARFLVEHAQPQDLIATGQRAKSASQDDVAIRMGRGVAKFTTLLNVSRLRSTMSVLKGPGAVWLIMPYMTSEQSVALKSVGVSVAYPPSVDTPYDQTTVLRFHSGSDLAANIEAALRTGAQLCLNAEECYRYFAAQSHFYLAYDRLGDAEDSFRRATTWLDAMPARSWYLSSHTALAAHLEITRLAAEEAQRLPAPVKRVDIVFAGQLRLLGYVMRPTTVSPGDWLEAEIYWQSLEPIGGNLVSSVRVTDLAGALLGETQARLATSDWQPGRVYTQSYLLHLDSALDPPLVANVAVTVRHSSTGETYPVTSVAPGSSEARLTHLRVIPVAGSVSKPIHVVDYNFADLISLVGYDIVDVPPGIVLYWKSHRPTDEDLTVFVHVLKADGTLIGQMDGPPRNGRDPTSRWLPGEVVVDAHSAPMAIADADRLMVGWYHLEDGRRLPLANMTGDAVTINLKQLD
jgi:4-amino-4-deoxy-L-arabinose transferase-like glycosyltransferase